MLDQVVYEAGWSSYEEYGQITIYEREDGSLYQVIEGYCVYGEPAQYNNDPEDISLEEALDLIVEWDLRAQENA